MRRRQTGIERVERRFSRAGCSAATVDHRRAVDLVGGFRATRRGGSRRRCHARGLSPVIEVDGGENCESAGQAIAAGANAIVAGSAIFGSRAHIVKRHEAGETPRSVASAVGVSPACVSKWLKRHNTNRPKF
ncbi:MAG: helix-turn-helix domain-containing protein [Methylocella sp.]